MDPVCHGGVDGGLRPARRRLLVAGDRRGGLRWLRIDGVVERYGGGPR